MLLPSRLVDEPAVGFVAVAIIPKRKALSNPGLLRALGLNLDVAIDG